MAWTEVGARGTRSASAAASTTVGRLMREADVDVPAEAAPEGETPAETGTGMASGSRPIARRTAL
eukprot:811056-Lingulodinium_polyedra.AAC.1